LESLFLKKKKKLKSIEDGSLVVFVFKNLIGWNTVLVIWKIHIGRIACPKSTFQLGRKIIQGETKEMVYNLLHWTFVSPCKFILKMYCILRWK